MKTGFAEKGPAKVIACSLLAVLFLALFSACSDHQPAPVEEQSDLVGKRKLNSDGTYSVRSGDTLYAIAFHYGMDPQDMAKWNDISSPYLIHPGQNLRLLAPPVSKRDIDQSSAVRISTVKDPGQVTTKTADSPAPSTAVKSTPPPTTTSAKKPSAVKTPAPTLTDPKVWKWPTDGRVLRTYVANDPARNGLDIAGREGQAVITSAPGQVVYSGDGLIGYGELIIIKHSEKMLSAYAHNKIRLVNEGDQVSVGQKIAEMGRNAGNEQILHFEIRVRGKPVNPLIYLPKK